MGYLVMIGQVLLSLSILVTLHEWGHFITARYFGIRVSKFYLFFDFLFPLSNVMNFAIVKRKFGDTEYGIGWFPLGGYVQIDGMVDETQTAESLAHDPEPWEFRSKPAWQRLIVILGGIIVNTLLGIFIIWMMLNVWGERRLPTENAKWGMTADSLAQVAGFRSGDVFKAINGVPVKYVKDIRHDLVFNEAKTVTVTRGGKDTTFAIDSHIPDALMSYRGEFMLVRTPFIIDSVPANSPNAKAGLQRGDRLLTFNGTPVLFADEIRSYLAKHHNTDIAAKALRGNDTLNIALHSNADGILNVFYKQENQLLEYSTHYYGFFASLPVATGRAFGIVGDNLKGFQRIFAGKVKATESVGSIGTFAVLFGKEWIWQKFWGLTAMLSMVLAFMNLLPIPVLDGGHAVFILYEMVTGRPPSDTFMKYAQMVGIALFLTLMVFAISMDVIRAFR